MRFGLALPHYDFSLPNEPRISTRSMTDWAVRAEHLGFDSVWISDHFLLSLARYGGPEQLRGSLEPMTALAALAARTSRVRLGTLVLCAPFRHPSVVAKMASTIDLLSGGRVDLGLGAGWLKEEFERFGYEFGSVRERFGVLEEDLEVLRALFSEGPSSVQGRRFELRDAVMRPRAAQRPRPPLWLGSKGGPRSLAIAARLADGWNTAWRWDPGSYGQRVSAARAACERAERDPSSLRRSVGLYTAVGADDHDLAARFGRLREWMPGLDDQTPESFAEATLTGTPDRVLDRVAAFAALGVEEIIITIGQIPFAIPDSEMVELIAERVVAPGRSI
jgi:probable F420-dependent oxidoreductase